MRLETRKISDIKIVCLIRDDFMKKERREKKVQSVAISEECSCLEMKRAREAFKIERERIEHIEKG